MTERGQPTESRKHLSEYNEARERFKNFSKHNSHEESNHLDELILKLCSGEFELETAEDASLFYDILYYADFLQIKDEFVGLFYKELCKAFILGTSFNDIDERLDQLEDIPQVKNHLIQGLFKILRVMPEIEEGYLVLKYSPEEFWYDNINFLTITNLRIYPSAYKAMLSNTKFNLTHLNFIFRFIGVQNLILNGCNLNGKNVNNLFKGLKLNYLGLSKCGTNVNTLFQEELLDVSNLSGLNISGNPLYNSTLEKIRNIRLRSLNINDSIKTTGTFVNTIWFAKNFVSQNQPQLCDGNIDLLWEDGSLQQTIQTLDVNHDLIDSNVKNISNLKLLELNIGNLKNVNLLQVDFSRTLRNLTLRDITVGYRQFAKLCSLPLERLDIHYIEISDEPDQNFAPLADSPLSGNLKELLVYFEEPSVNFIAFVSKLHLTFFKCDGELENESLDLFICDYEHRKYTESLFIQGVFLDLTPAFIHGISKLHLKEFGLGLPESIEYQHILNLKNLQETVENLWLREQECGECELKQIVQFKKLKKLAFTFTAGVSAVLLQIVANMKTLEYLEAEAMIKGQLNIRGVHSLCAIPLRTLFVFDDYNKSITDEAFQYLSEAENYANFCRNCQTLNLRSLLKSNMAKILGGISWETVIINSSPINKNDLKLFFQNENLIYTLEFLKLMDLDLDWEDIGNILISEMIVEQYDLPEKAFETLATKPISNFLRYILFEDRKIKRSFLLETNISEIDTYG